MSHESAGERPAGSWAWLAVALPQALVSLWLIRAPSFDKYPALAALLRSGKLTARYAAVPSPLYLLLNAFLSPQAMRALQMLAGALVIALVYRVVRFFAKAWAALAASALLAFCAPFLAYETVLEPDFLLMSALFAGCCLAIGGKSARSGFFSAVLLGAAVSLRPLALPACAIALGWRFFRNQGGSRFLPLLAFLACAAGPSLAISSATRSPLLATMSGGTVLYEGSRPESSGDGGQPPYALKILEKQLGAKQGLPDYAHELYHRFSGVDSASANQRYWLALWARFFRAHPRAFFRLQLRKLALTLAGPENIDLRGVRKLEYTWSAGEVPFFPIPASWLFALGLAGVVLFCVSAPELSPLAAVWGALALSIALFYPSERYALVLLPLLAVFAASLAGASPGRRCDTVRGFPWRGRRAPAALCGIALAALLASLPVVRESRRFNERLMAASRIWAAIPGQVSSGRFDRARASLEEAQADFPFGEWAADFRFLPFESPDLAARSAARSEAQWGKADVMDRAFLAELYDRAGGCAKVEKLAATLPAHPILPTYYDLLFDPRLMAARCRASAGDQEGARAWIDRSLLAFPGNAGALALGYAVEKKLGRATQAQGFKQELFFLHDPVSAELELSKNLRAVGSPEARLSIELALSQIPESALLAYEKARVVAQFAGGDVKRYAEAAQLFNQAIEELPELNYRVLPLDPGFARLFNDGPRTDLGSVEARIRELARLGRVAEALSLAREWTSQGDLEQRKALAPIYAALEELSRDQAR